MGSSQPSDDERGGLLEWQRRLYPDNHTERANLAIHLLTVPLFHLGTVTFVIGWLLAAWMPLFGILTMTFAVIAQGRGHKMERVAPVKFRNAADVVMRIFVEQWITFPRFLFSGGFARAWSRAR